METHNGIPSLHAKTRREWRKWLEKNHDKTEKLWLIMYHKKSGVASVTYEEAVLEALCFGWIDSKPNKRDAESAYLFFCKRKPKSVWSKINKDRVARLLEEGLMTPAGMKMVELAKKTGTWNALSQIDKIMIPADLKKEFSTSKIALKNFEAFPPSSKKIILTWIMSAKRPETREKRIKETVRLAKENLRANHYVKKA